MDHDSIIYFMGPDGKFIAPVHTEQSPATMAANVSELMPWVPHGPLVRAAAMA
jgi:cytochrome oxidase Cu insertion factor (SCO1/SenC/PrrC family)